jgi:RNA polymerase sigma-70 factor (ECF subfamily)
MDLAPSAGEIAERLRRGDTEAERLLYERFGRRIHFLAARDLRSSFRADDVRSETMIRVISAIRDGRLRLPDALPGFVLQTARNVIQEQHRHDRRHVALDQPDAAVPEPAAPIQPESVDRHVARALRRAIGALNSRDRLCLRLHYFDELPREEVAKRLGVSEERVRLVKSRALQRFREAYRQLTEEGGFDTSTP